MNGEDRSHSIAETVILTGISADVLRSWERRYKAVRPDRDDSGDRVYAENQIARIRLLRRAVESNHSIKKIAKYNNDQLDKLLLLEGDPFAREVTEFLGYLLEFKTAAASHQQIAIATRYGVQEIIYGIIVPMFEQYRARCGSGEFNSIHEQVFVTLLHNLLGHLRRLYPPPKTEPPIMLSACGDQTAMLGTLMGSLIALHCGYDAIFTGLNPRPAELCAALRQSGAWALYIGMWGSMNGAGDAWLAGLAKHLPESVQVIAGSVVDDAMLDAAERLLNAEIVRTFEALGGCLDAARCT